MKKSEIKKICSDIYIDLGDLDGPDGNAFWILGKCNQAMVAAGLDNEAQLLFDQEAKTGDYNHLLSVVADWFPNSRYHRSGDEE